MKCDDYDGSKLDEQHHHHHHHAFPTLNFRLMALTRHFRSRTGPGRFHALKKKHLLGDPRLPL